MSTTEYMMLTTALVGALITLSIFIIQDRNARRKLTINLHESYWSIEHYRFVIAPSYAVQVKWDKMNDTFRKKYQESVLQGWDLYNESDQYRRIVGDQPLSDGDFIKQHFLEPVGHEMLTEHQALTSLFNTWSNFVLYYKNKLVDRKLFVNLFRGTFQHNHKFFKSFCETWENTNSRRINEGKSAAKRPPFIDNFKDLDKLFYSNKTS